MNRWAKVLSRDYVTKEALAKIPFDNTCHSERSEESRIFKKLRSFTQFRMTEKPILQEAQKVEGFPPPP
jgi:hypothetical protein